MQTRESIYFRKAGLPDLEKIVSLYQGAIEEMNRNNIPQWDELYPDRQILEEDIMKQELYVGTARNIICAAFVLNQEADLQYAKGRWKWKDSAFYVIHRLCVSPAFQNQRIGTRTIAYIEQLLKEQEIETIRLDAFSRNPYALKMYHTLGYETVGEAHFRKGMFYLMEKKI